MKAMKIFFLYYLFKVVVGLPDFRDLPQFDDLLRKGVLDDQPICSKVTSYACISPLRNRGISKDNYSAIAQSYIRRNAIRLLNENSENNANSGSEREDDVQTIDIDRESVWFSACLGRDGSTKYSFQTLKETMEKAEGLQDPERDDLPSWEYIAGIYAHDFGFSPFFEVVLHNDNRLKIRRPYSMKMKSYLRGELPSLIENFLHKFSNDGNSIKNQIRNGLNANADTFLSYLNTIPSEHEVLSFADFSEKFNIDFDWSEHLEDIGLKLDASDVLYIDADYFKLLKGFLVELGNAEVANLIHFLYAMNSKVFSTWHRGDSVNKYTEEECFSHMPFKSGIVNEIVNDHLTSRLSLIKKMLENIIEQYEEEINNSWLDTQQKSLFLDRLQYLEIKITDEKLTTIPHDVIDALFYVAGNGLKNIIQFEKAHNNFKIERYRRSQTELIGQINRNKYGSHFVPYVNYNIKDNILEIPLDELLLPLFDSELTIAWNYAYFGVAISRELFKLHNNLYSLIAKYSQPFTSKMDCFKMLQYPVRETVNFDNLINSCVGLKIAYKAFKKEIKLNEDNIHKISGLHYTTPKQQFFIAYSAIYCNERDAETVDISVANKKSFAKAFQCEADSPMNPSRRCDFWSKPEEN